MRVTRTAEETAHCQLLVSVRKRVERAFGLNKQRFRLLKTPMLFKTKQQVDNVMLTCCRLHNKLGDARGVRTKWDGIFDNDWSEDELKSLKKKLRRKTSLAKMVERISGVDFDASSSGFCGRPDASKRAGHDELQQKLIAHCAAAEMLHVL